MLSQGNRLKSPVSKSSVNRCGRKRATKFVSLRITTSIGLRSDKRRPLAVSKLANSKNGLGIAWRETVAFVGNCPEAGETRPPSSAEAFKVKVAAGENVY